MTVEKKLDKILKTDTSLVVPTEQHFKYREKFLYSPNHEKYTIEHKGLQVTGRDAYLIKMLKKVASDVLSNTNARNIVELLPGSAEEFPLAFSMAGYTNRYDKIDLFHFLGEKETLKIRKRYAQLGFRDDSQIMISDIFLWAKHLQSIKYDVAISKHPFDDMIIGLYAMEKGITSYEYFTDPVCCKKHWKEAVLSYEKYLVKIKHLAKNLSRHIRKGGVFITINHPDTFSVKNRMKERIVLTQYTRNVFLYEMLRNGFEFITTEGVDEYNENTYPNSLIILKKTKDSLQEDNNGFRDMVSNYLNKNKPDTAFPNVFSVISHHGEIENWYLNTGGRKIHSEIGCLIDFIRDRAQLCTESYLVYKNIKEIERYFLSKTHLNTDIIKLFKESMDLIDIQASSLEIFTTLQPCISRSEHMCCKEILNSLGIDYTYGSCDSIEQSHEDFLFTCDTFINYNRLHFMSLYFLKYFRMILVNGGDLFVKKNRIQYYGGFTSEDDLAGLSSGILFINTKKISLEEASHRMSSEGWKPFQIILNVDNRENYRKKDLKEFFGDIKTTVVTYY